MAEHELEQAEAEVELAEALDDLADSIDAELEVLDEDDLLAEAAEPVESPYDRPGQWFVVHTQSGYEKKVKQNLEARISSMNMEERIHEVVIPMEDVVEVKNGKKVVVQKKVFPGYLLVRCNLDDDSWYVVRNTPGVTGFVGQGAKPSPLPRRDVEAFLQVKPEGEEPTRKGKPRHEYEPGETVRVKEGPVRRLLGRDRGDQRGSAQGEGAGQHLRPRDPRRARVLPGGQALTLVRARFGPAAGGSCHRWALRGRSQARSPSSPRRRHPWPFGRGVGFAGRQSGELWRTPKNRQTCRSLLRR